MVSTPEQRRRARERRDAAQEAAARMEQAGVQPEPQPVPSEPERPKASQSVRRKKRRVTGEVTPEAQAALHEVVIVAVAGLSMFAPESIRPTSADVDAIFIPAERIYLRHASVPEISPDTTDAIACLMGVFGYVSHVKFPAIKRRQRSRQTQQESSGTYSGPAENPTGNPGPTGGDTNGAGTGSHVAEVLTRLHSETFGRGTESDYDGS